ncbi:hypothetical protein FKM82_029074 [Ascaphus truei]
MLSHSLPRSQLSRSHCSLFCSLAFSLSLSRSHTLPRRPWCFLSLVFSLSHALSLSLPRRPWRSLARSALSRSPAELPVSLCSSCASCAQRVPNARSSRPACARYRRSPRSRSLPTGTRPETCRR